jgi:hypothetical protein
MSPDNCCAGCCSHYGDRNTGSNAKPAIEDWIRTNEGDLAACLRRRQTDAVHELIKFCLNDELIWAFRLRFVMNTHNKTSVDCTLFYEAAMRFSVDPEHFSAF